MNHQVNYSISDKSANFFDRNADQSVHRENTQLFRMGDRLSGIYIVNSGILKLFTITQSGEEHIVRFCMPGDLLGLEALSDGISKTNALVLNIANVSFLSLQSIMSLKSELDIATLMQGIADTLVHETEHCMMVSHATAARRVAWFLCEYAQRLDRRGLVAKTFDVPMTRQEIGLYLGLAVETVSRELAKLAKQGIIERELKHIEIVDTAALNAIAKNSKVLH